MSSVDLDLAGLDLGEQEVEHDDAARGPHVEAAGRRPVAEVLDDAVMGSDLNGFGFESSWCAPVRCRSAVRQPRWYLATASGTETARMAAAQTSERAT